MFHRGELALRKAWWAYACLGVCVAVAYPLLPTDLAIVAFFVAGVAGVAAIVVGLGVHRPERPLPWVLLACGAALLVAGDRIFAWLESQQTTAAFPSVADAVYLSAYPFLILALAVVVRRSGPGNRAAWLNAGIWTGGALVAAWLPLIAPYADDASLQPLERAVALAYPLADLVVLVLLVHVMGRSTQAGTAHRLVGGAFVSMLVADVVYGVRALEGTYHSGELTDLGWIAFSFLIGLAALHPSMRLLPEQVIVHDRPSQLRLLSLTAPALAAPGLLATLVLRGDLTGDRNGGLLVAGATAVLIVLSALRGRGLILDLRAREAVLEAAVQDRERLAEELRSRATSCALTGLVNRTGFLELTSEALESNEPLAVGLLDLDDFKGVNDSLGHEAGDSLLVAVAARLRGAIGPRDVVGRLGGDEFALLLRGDTEATANRVVDVLGAPLLLDGHELRVEASLGLVSRTDRSSLGDLLRRADVAMYAAKGAGGNRWTGYEAEMSASLLRRLDLRSQLVRALERDEIEPWFQPVVDLASGDLLGFEALARWQRPGRGIQLPGEWIGLAEETGLVVPIDQAVLRQAVREAVRWRTLVRDCDLDLAVNASGRTLQEPGTATRILELLEREGLPPSALVLEVTEGVLLEDEAVGRRLQTLRAAGVRIALDDFGTGWSSLAYLSRFPVDVLKLDRSFTAGLGQGVGGEAVPAAVVQLARALELDVIAEGVETVEQADRLRELGAANAQGYLFGRPASAEATRRLVIGSRVLRPSFG